MVSLNQRCTALVWSSYCTGLCMYVYVLLCFIKYSKSLLILRLQLSCRLQPFENSSWFCWFVHYMLGKYNLSGGESLWTWCSYVLNFRNRFELFQCCRSSDDYISAMLVYATALKVCSPVLSTYVSVLWHSSF